MSDVKRWKARGDVCWLAPNGAEKYPAWDKDDLESMQFVLASDYDALADELAEAKRDSELLAKRYVR
jgi:hypothetical protein